MARIQQIKKRKAAGVVMLSTLLAGVVTTQTNQALANEDKNAKTDEVKTKDAKEKAQELEKISKETTGVTALTNITKDLNTEQKPEEKKDAQSEKTKEEKREKEYKTLKTDLGKVATKIALIDNGEVQTKDAEIAKKVQKLNLKSEKKVIEDKVHAIDKEIESEKEAKRKAEAEKVAKDKAKKQETERKAQVTQALAQPSTPVGPSTIHAAIKQVANSYPWGQCTWGVKNLAPWAGDYWGNADMWAASAASQGFKVGTKPVAGAIAVWSGMHVAYVTDVQSETKIQVLESNFAGNPNIGNYRGWFNPVNAQGTVSYIYPPGS